MVAVLRLPIPPSSSRSAKELCISCGKAARGREPSRGDAARSASLSGSVNLALVTRSVPAHRIAASSAAALDTGGHLPRGRSTPAAAPLPPLTLVPRPSPPSYISPPPSPSATTANVAVTVRPTWRRRKAARYAGGTLHLNAQGPYLATVVTLPSTTAGLPPPSPCPPPPAPGSFRRVRPTSTTTGLNPLSPCPPPTPRGSSRRVQPTSTTTGLTPPSPCPPPPPRGSLAIIFRQAPLGCPRRQPAAHGNRQLSQWLLPREQTEELMRRVRGAGCPFAYFFS